MDIWQWVANLWLQEVLFLRRLEAFNLTWEPKWNVASGQGNNVERRNTAAEWGNPTGEANSHYRLLRKLYKLLKGSLNKVVKCMEWRQEPTPCRGVVGHPRATPDSPEAALHWTQAQHKAVPSTSTDSYATTWGHGIPLTTMSKSWLPISIGRTAPFCQGCDNFHGPSGVPASISHLSLNKWGSIAPWAQWALPLVRPPRFN